MTGNRRGMTLLELMVALVVTGFMAAIGTSAFGTIIDRRTQIVQATVVTERTAALRETIHSWLVSGTIQIQQGGLPQTGRGRGAGSTVRTSTPGSSTSSVQSVTAATASGDELTFTTQAPNPAGAAGATIRLFIDGDDKTPESGLTIEYRASTQAPLLRRQLEGSIGAMVVEYLDTRTRRWYAASQAATITPGAVRISFTDANGDLMPGLLSEPIVLPIGTSLAKRTTS